ncbi:hypothetical protein AC629_02620 [Bradyrhizobium sp. NAS80.1]|nr:hypothetical protein AC629_02620 [Bradyrhizobium sp. NAS80.1]
MSLFLRVWSSEQRSAALEPLPVGETGVARCQTTLWHRGINGGERRREEATRENERAKRETAIARAQAALDKARKEHEERAESLEAKRGCD